MTSIRRVLVAFAMREEAAPFVENCKLECIPETELKWPPTLPVVAYRGRVGDCEVVACWTGQDSRFLVNNVATTAAAVAAYAVRLKLLCFGGDMCSRLSLSLPLTLSPSLPLSLSLSPLALSALV